MAAGLNNIFSKHQTTWASKTDSTCILVKKYGALELTNMRFISIITQDKNYIKMVKKIVRLTVTACAQPFPLTVVYALRGAASVL